MAEQSTFFGIASQAMRRILINYANSRAAQKRGSGTPDITLAENLGESFIKPDELIDLDEALNRLEKKLMNAKVKLLSIGFSLV
ncbi:MAG: hypothetical protein H6613_14945 [Ignavibacteriales bacterium]|nr:hypothetical protein [Ignavibacteriales bacterium]